ncbi:hypothetical protein Tco_1283394 [Tanacetum coccineum]
MGEFGTGYQEKDKNKDKTGQNQARDWKERKITSPTRVRTRIKDVEHKDSNVSNFDELVLLNTPLFDEDECFDPGGDINKIDDFLDDYNDSEGDVLEILHNTTHNLFPEVFFDHDPRSLKDEPDNDDLMTEDKVFDPEVMEKIFSPSYVRLSSKDRHYLFFTIVFSFSGFRYQI